MYTKAIAFMVLSVIACGVSAQQTVVLLKNGNVLKGAVQRDGFRVEVRSASGTIILDSDNVDYLCESMEEAFRLKQASTDPNDVESQVAVLRWCLKHEMYKEAYEQIDVLQLLPIEASRLDYLNRQLTVAVDRKKRIAQANIQPLQPRAVDNAAPNAPGEIAQVGYEETIEIMPLPNASGNSASNQVSLPASKRAVEEFTKSFPGEVVSQYKREIEPKLVRNCSNAGCHNGSHESFPLLKKGFGRDIQVPRLLSQRNFYRLMKFVDLNEPLESSLYLKATQPHGGQSQASYGPIKEETKALEAWLLSIATPEAQRAHYQRQMEIANAANANQHLNASPEFPATQVRQANANLPDSSIPSVPNLTPRSQTFVPKDPFDPEIFNRKYRKRD